jgi:hypothetical protein
MIEALGKTDLDRVLGDEKHNRDRLGRSMRGQRRDRAGERRDQGHGPADQLGRHPGQPVVVSVGPAKLDRDIAAFDIAGSAETLTEAGETFDVGLGRAGMQESDCRHRGLLGACHIRPRHHRGGRAAEQRDKFAPLHRIPQ